MLRDPAVIDPRFEPLGDKLPDRRQIRKLAKAYGVATALLSAGRQFGAARIRWLSSLSILWAFAGTN
jgi:hypothetical protein